MNVPARVAADAAAADATLAALAEAARTPPAPASNEAPPPASNEPPTAPPPAPAAPTAQPVDLHAELARLNQLAHTQAGRLEAESRERQRLADQLQRLQSQPPAAAPAPPPPPAAPLVTSQDEADYGAPLLDLIRRMIRQEAGSRLEDQGTRLAQLEGKIGKTTQQVEQVTQTTAQRMRADYESALDRLYPGWEAVNEDPAFLSWLQQREQASGRQYHELLVEAHQRTDAQRVAHIFSLYKPQQSAPAPDANPPAAPAQPTRVDPATLAAPATQPPAPPPATPPAGRIWSMKEVDKLYEDRQKGRISQTDFAAQEKEYLKALAEGRVAAV